MTREQIPFVLAPATRHSFRPPHPSLNLRSHPHATYIPHETHNRHGTTPTSIPALAPLSFCHYPHQKMLSNSSGYASQPKQRKSSPRTTRDRQQHMQTNRCKTTGWIRDFFPWMSGNLHLVGMPGVTLDR